MGKLLAIYDNANGFVSGKCIATAMEKLVSMFHREANDESIAAIT
jgi:hypothetical protein